MKLKRVSALVLLILFTQILEVRAAPDDPLIGREWGWFKIGADKAYEAGLRGEGIVVAVLDTGVDRSHPDLSDNILQGWNFVENNDDTTDRDGHGTMVTGVIAAIAGNKVGIAGVASKAKILPVKVLTAQGGSCLSVDRGIMWAADHGAKVISMSLGGSNSQRCRRIDVQAITYALSRNIVLVAAAGNENTDEPVFPAAYSESYAGVIAVTAIDQSSKKATFSNFGSYVNIAAPGVEIASTFPGAKYAAGSGTSFAAPFVSGVAALLLSKSPHLSPSQVRETLCRQATPIGGSKDFYGCGLVNASALAAGSTTPPTEPIASKPSNPSNQPPSPPPVTTSAPQLQATTIFAIVTTIILSSVVGVVGAVMLILRRDDQFY